MSINRTSQYPFQHLMLIGLLAFFLSGCVSLADPETSQVHQKDVVFTLPPDTSDWIGQSFVSRREGLNSITIYTESVDDALTSPPVLIAELFHQPLEDQPVFSTRLSARNGSIKIAFPAQNDPPITKYFLKLRASGQSLQIMGRNEDIYPYGEVYASGVPLPGDLAFSSTYDYGIFAFLKDLKYTLPEIPLVRDRAARSGA